VPSSYSQAAAEEGLEGACLPRQFCAEYHDSFPTGPLAHYFASCSLIVGMHPDEATEPIVDTALRYGKPFAVVPCCVFPHSNPHRKLADGTPVAQHEQFCEYLRQKAPHVSKTVLPSFEGRNIVVYSVPPPP